jgi:hypothetical protein
MSDMTARRFDRMLQARKSPGRGTSRSGALVRISWSEWGASGVHSLQTIDLANSAASSGDRRSSDKERAPFKRIALLLQFPDVVCSLWNTARERRGRLLVVKTKSAWVAYFEEPYR